MSKFHRILLLLTAGIALMLLMLEVKGQGNQSFNMLQVTANKTTSIVFPDVIKSVDRGGTYVLAQKARGVENVLLVKAARPNFPETNLTVITSDGTIHHFTVAFSDNPAQMVRYVESPSTETIVPTKLIFPTDITESEIRRIATKLSGTRQRIHFFSDIKSKMKLSLLGIYIKGQFVFYQFRIDNSSNIDYDLDFSRFYIRDVQRVKRSASQEIDITPLFIHGNDKFVKGQATEELVVVLNKFTIPDGKRLIVEIFEKNGGRNLQLSIPNRKIIGAELVK